MRKTIVIICFLICFQPVIASSNFPEEIKGILQKNYTGIEFKIDNSFVVGNKTFIPLAPRTPRATNSIDIIFTIPGKPLPQLIWFSNDWAYARLLEQDDSSKTIVSLKDIPEPYKERFLKMKLPDDLVVPKGFVLSDELSSLSGDLPITILESEEWIPGQAPSIKDEEDSNKAANKEDISYVVIDKTMKTKEFQSNLFLTSPADGKIAHFNSYNSSEIKFIDTMGMPWNLAYNKKSMAIYVTDFFQNKIYEIDFSNPQGINTTLNLTEDSNPKDIAVESKGSHLYVLETKNRYFTVVKKDQNKTTYIKKKLALDPAYFTINYAQNTIALSHPSINQITFLDLTTLQDEGYIEASGGPSDIVNDGNYFYVANRFNDTVLVIDALSKIIVEEIKVDQAPTALALDQKKKHLYVSCGKENTIHIIDTTTYQTKDKFPLPAETRFPSDLELSKSGKWLIATSEDSTTISIIDLEGKNKVQTLDIGVPTHSALLIED